jgi:multiphosphoryl transfer protein
MMVGLVIVSHSARLAEGVAELVRGVGGADLALAVTGGLDLPGQPLGTDAMLVLHAIETVYSDDGVLVLMDLGSAVLSAELALDLLPPERQDHVVLCEAPLVEGAVAAAVQARLGRALPEVRAEARGALAAKAAHLGGGVPRPAEGATAAASERHERRLRVQNAAGLHARPAAAFVQAAGKFGDAIITLRNLTAGRGPADARSINAVLTLGVRQGDEVLLSASGPGSVAALQALADLVGENSESGAVDTEPWLPEKGACADSGPESGSLRGIPASPGAAVGAAHAYPSAQSSGAVLSPPYLRPEPLTAGPQAEWEALQAALSRTAEQIRATRDAVAVRAGRAAADIFEAQCLFLSDAALLAPIRSAIFHGGSNATAAWQAAVDRVAESYAALGDDTLRSRGADLVDVGRQVLGNLSGAILNPETTTYAGPVILVARDLNPTEAAHLDPDTVRGVCTALGGPTSHAAILARALGIPYVAGLGEAILRLAEGALLAMDGATGCVWPHPPPDFVEECTKRAEADRVIRSEARLGSATPAVTRDGHRVEIGANIGSVKDAEDAVDLGADGVGLFRAEFLFGARQDPPGEDEQVAVYRAAAAALGGRPLVIRTLDAGGDKPLPCLRMPDEANPFLGWRGIRICLARPEIFLPQLRAIVRVAAEFPVKVMFPMIATLGEWREAVALLAAARGEVLARGDRAAAPIETGIMVEIPAAALLARQFAAEVDFFSIGTNDLAQFTLAAERGNTRLAALADPLQPAVLRLIRDVVDAGHARRRWVGVCGELAADPLAIPLLVGLGVDELSMNAVAIPRAKQIIRDLDQAAVQTLAGQVLQVGDAEGVRALLASAQRLQVFPV